MHSLRDLFAFICVKKLLRFAKGVLVLTGDLSLRAAPVKDLKEGFNANERKSVQMNANGPAAASAPSHALNRGSANGRS
jgi:hypothetical protein